MEPTFTEFMAPGVILSITYFMAVCTVHYSTVQYSTVPCVYRWA